MQKKSSTKCAFTIVAKNYIGLAKVLESSIKEYTPDVDFIIFVADEFDSERKNDMNFENVIISKSVLPIPEKKWIDMSFKYNITEFCTSIKPWCFQFLFTSCRYDKAIYFDPDILTFSSISPLYNDLEKYSAVLTPHCLFPTKDSYDKCFLQSGPYNLGFLALKNNQWISKLLEWWGQRLLDNCFDELLEYTFTDQKWMLMIHSYLPQSEILVSRNLGLNVAPWNFKERKIEKTEYGYNVVCRYGEDVSDELIFIHFSGYDYKALLDGKEIRPRVSKEIVDFDDVKGVMDIYAKKLKESEQGMRRYLDLPYSYATFNNGIKIEKFHRRIYHRLAIIDNGRYSNPFTSENNSFFELIRGKGLLHTNHKDKSQSIDRTKNITKLLKSYNYMMKVIYKIIGYHRYLMLLRLMKHFSRYESQVFLVDKKYNGNNVEIPEKQIV